MSSILKALRKLEEEKSARQEGAVDIARDILRLPARRREGRRNRLLAFGGGMLLSALAVGALLWVWRPDVPSVQHGDIVQVPAPVPGKVQEPIATVPVLPPPPPAVRPANPPTGALRRVPAEERIIEETVSHPPIHSHATNAARARKKSSAASPRPTVPTPPAAPPLPEAKPPSSAASPAFILSGIVHQSDPNGRVAVINDLPVMTGTVIDGATVNEILPDRVRLDLPNGRALDLFLEP